MRTARDLFTQLHEPSHLDAAATRTTRGKRRRPDVAWFLFRREAVLARLQAALRDGTWQPRGFDRLLIADPKPRVIGRPSIEDRVVHAALALLLEPVILRSAIATDFACRPGFGTHRALLTLLAAMRRHDAVLHLDIRSYFPSIELDILRRQLLRRVRDPRFFAVVDAVLERGRGFYDPPRARRHARMDEDWPPRGRGLPMGATTSQLFAAHLYLQDFDHFVKRDLKVPDYVRYVDDMFVFGPRAALRAWREQIAGYLGERLELRLKRPDAPVLSCRGTLDGLGARVDRRGIRPLPGAWRRLGARLGAFVRGHRGTGSNEALQRSLAGGCGHLFFG